MLDKNYWQNRYDENQTGWDAGSITLPIKEYFDKIQDKTVKILIPGCGNAHEAAYLFEQGFQNVYLCDWAEAPLENFSKQCPNFPKSHLICADFFELKERDFDYVIEQTFFCALDPKLRSNYARKMSEILKKGGRLVGLLFSIEMEKQGPPFGGNKAEYLTYFEPYFSKISIEPCLNSIKPRMGAEFFIDVQM